MTAKLGHQAMQQSIQGHAVFFEHPANFAEVDDMIKHLPTLVSNTAHSSKSFQASSDAAVGGAGGALPCSCLQGRYHTTMQDPLLV
jgi:hypothetical protein